MTELIRLAPRVFRFAASRVGPDQAEDVTSETLTNAWIARGKFQRRGRNDLQLWVLGIANNMLRRHREAEHRWITMRSDTLRVIGDAMTTVEAGEAVRRSNACLSVSSIAQAVKSLPRREREPLLLFVLQDLTYEQVALALDIPVGTVRSRINRGRTRVVNHLQAEDRA